MRENLLNSMIEECRTWMGEPSLVFDTSGMKDEDIARLKEEIRSRARRNGCSYPILKSGDSSIYVF